MRLKVNGQIIENSEATTVKELLDEMEINPGRVAVEVNLFIIKKADYDKFVLSDKDSVEIINFVGGG